MILTTKARGHLLTSLDNGVSWFYEDGEPYGKDRACTSCGILAGPDEPDPCLGMLPDVDFACCGHGDSSYEYVKTGDIRYDSVDEWNRATMSDTSNN